MCNSAPKDSPSYHTDAMAVIFVFNAMKYLRSIDWTDLFGLKTWLFFLHCTSHEHDIIGAFMSHAMHYHLENQSYF